MSGLFRIFFRQRVLFCPEPGAQYQKQRRQEQSVPGIGEDLKAKFIYAFQERSLLHQTEVAVPKQADQIEKGGDDKHGRQL